MSMDEWGSSSSASELFSLSVYCCGPVSQSVSLYKGVLVFFGGSCAAYQELEGLPFPVW
jgi:hypothetical protein